MPVLQVPAGEEGEPGGFPNLLKEEVRRRIRRRRRRMMIISRRWSRATRHPSIFARKKATTVARTSNKKVLSKHMLVVHGSICDASSLGEYNKIWVKYQDYSGDGILWLDLSDLVVVRPCPLLVTPSLGRSPEINTERDGVIWIFLFFSFPFCIHA